MGKGTMKRNIHKITKNTNLRLEKLAVHVCDCDTEYHTAQSLHILQTTVNRLMLSVGGQTMICLCLQVALLQLRHHSSVCDKMMNVERLRVLQSSLPKDAA